MLYEIGMQGISNEQKLLQQGFINNADIISHALDQRSIGTLTRNPTSCQQFIDRARQVSSEIVELNIHTAAPKGRSPNGYWHACSSTPSLIHKPSDPEDINAIRFGKEIILPNFRRAKNNRIARHYLNVTEPVSDETGHVVGTMGITFNLQQEFENIDRLENDIKWKIRLGTGASVLLTLLFLLLAVLLIRHKVLLRIHHITEIAQKIADGDLTLRIEDEENDEIGTLVKNFNHMTVEVHTMQERLRLEATKDHLTGLWNKREIQRRLEQEVSHCKRVKRGMALLMIDIDYFKKVNDNYGHPVGDEVLVEITRRLSSTLRPYDVVGRYGGEEFLALILDCPIQSVKEIAERLRQAVADHPCQTAVGPIQTSVSIGMALFRKDYDDTATNSADFLLKAADLALYAAKDAGRNCVRIAEDERSA